MAKAQYEKLFTPIVLNNGVTIDNHLAVAPVTHFCANPDGTLSDEEREYLRDRARDFGIYVFAATLVERTGKAFVGEPYALTENDLPSLAERARIIKDAGAKAVMQLHHGGFRALPAEVPDGKVYSVDEIRTEEIRSYIAQTSGPDPKVYVLTDEHIRAIINGFAKAAELAIRAGWDGVEIHGANNYLNQQFYSPATNKRSDSWGGSLENRMKFHLAVIDAVVKAKERFGRPEFIIGCRISPEEPFEDGITMTDTLALIGALNEKPLQYVHISLHDFFSHNRRGASPSKMRLETIHDAFSGSSIALMGVGGLQTADDVLRAYDTGTVDFVAVARANMVNRYFARLIKDGREDQIETAFHESRIKEYGLPKYLWEVVRRGGWLPPLIK